MLESSPPNSRLPLLDYSPLLFEGDYPFETAINNSEDWAG
jgi:hypothetical protein